MGKRKSTPKKNQGKHCADFRHLPARFTNSEATDGSKVQHSLPDTLEELGGISGIALPDEKLVPDADEEDSKPPPKKKKKKKFKRLKKFKKKKQSKEEGEVEVEEEFVFRPEVDVTLLTSINANGTEIPGNPQVFFYKNRGTKREDPDETNSAFKRANTDGVRLLEWNAPMNLTEVTTSVESQSESVDNISTEPELPVEITTSQGATEIIKLCLRLEKDGSDDDMRDEKKSSRFDMKYQHIAVAVEKGLFRLVIEAPSKAVGSASLEQPGYRVILLLAKHAFDLCNPATLAVGNRRASNAFQDAQTLNHALVEVFPKHAEMLPMPQANDEGSITAKEVYALVDNVKLKEVMSRKKPPPTRSNTSDTCGPDGQLKIPGLVPKLRPYQESAVQWMLEREQGDTSRASSSTNRNNGREWECAWVVVQGTRAVKGKQAKSATAPRLYFLPDYLEHFPRRKRSKQSCQFLFCPYTGWLAQSVDDARDMTFRSMVRGKQSKDDSVSGSRGGILADSMGLGKTVEVLACILANPDPNYRRPEVAAQGNLISLPSSSSLVSGEKSPQAIEATESEPKKKCTKRPSSSQEEPLDKDSKRRRITRSSAKKEVEPSTGEVACDGIVSPSDISLCSTQHDVPIEPPTSLEERWIDSDEGELGSCICGVSLSFFPDMPPEDSVVICEGCQEPMHWSCAAFGTEAQELARMSKGVLFRHKLSKDAFWCRLCPERYCPCCVANDISKTNSKLRSRATIIVTPTAILNQWEREIRLHTGAHDESTGSSRELKVVVYQGLRSMIGAQKQRRGGQDKFRFVHPRWLADADIILTNFDALHQDLGHSDKNPFTSGKSTLRKRKRYRVVPSPLTSISWWRVCLDEAQQVETPTAGSAQMALKLDTAHRWAVSGTPIWKGKLDDLFGLLLFLKATPPFNDKNWFRQCFSSFNNGPFVGKRIQHLLRSVFWRSTKSFSSVAEQMAVPPQVEKKTQLRFSSIEKHFYNRHLEETLQIAGEIPQDDDLDANKGNGSLEVLSRQLHKLRAACCHPQVGSSGLAVGKRAGAGAGDSYGSVKVLSMGQVLDRLIDDAKNQCEEALRTTLFHTNPMAAIARLKVDAKNSYGVASIPESDVFLYSQSCKLYQDALNIADENAVPSLLTGEAWLSGSRGFRSTEKRVRGGSVVLDWQFRDKTGDENEGYAKDMLWAKFEFEGQPKRINQIRVRTRVKLPSEFPSTSWEVKYPKECVLQVSKTDDEFVDIFTFTLPEPGPSPEDGDPDWVAHSRNWIPRSKNWRIVVRSFHPGSCASLEITADARINGYVGLDLELFEPAVAGDSLPRLHVLHNAILSFRELMKVDSSRSQGRLPMHLTKTEAADKIHLMERELSQIEGYLLEYAKGHRAKCLASLERLSTTRRALENELFQLWKDSGHSRVKGFWDVNWWEEVTTVMALQDAPREKASLIQRISEAISLCKFYGEKTKQNDIFPNFETLNGFNIAMKGRCDDILGGARSGKYQDCIQAMMHVPSNPTTKEIFENKNCNVCKAEFYVTGAKCSHCKLEDKLTRLQTEEFKLVRYILDGILKWLKANHAYVDNSSSLRAAPDVASKFFEVYEASTKELIAARKVWRSQAEYMNVIAEIDTCKASMRLAHGGELPTGLTDDEQRGNLVDPANVNALYHDHAAKQAMALGNLQRRKNTLDFLKNQHREEGSGAKQSDEHCPICLNSFTSHWSVLKCGHSLCLDCVKELQKRPGGSSTIKCPNRCAERTCVDEMLTASTKRTDDGSRSRRKVKGSWGTKVTAIVSDLLAFSDLGEKSIVYSMWEDMLDIVQEALDVNNVKYARASGTVPITAATKKFRSNDCFVLLLSVKKGSAGLNLIEATRVIMIEPLLNCGLDSQAVARCHRIGQTRQTFVHRYIVSDSIEEKIDQYRTRHQEDQLEDSIMGGRKAAIHAGGIDGGFSSKQELMDMLSPS